MPLISQCPARVKIIDTACSAFVFSYLLLLVEDYFLSAERTDKVGRLIHITPTGATLRSLTLSLTRKANRQSVSCVLVRSPLAPRTDELTFCTGKSVKLQQKWQAAPAGLLRDTIRGCEKATRAQHTVDPAAATRARAQAPCIIHQCVAQPFLHMWSTVWAPVRGALKRGRFRHSANAAVHRWSRAMARRSWCCDRSEVSLLESCSCELVHKVLSMLPRWRKLRRLAQSIRTVRDGAWSVCQERRLFQGFKEPRSQQETNESHACSRQAHCAYAGWCCEMQLGSVVHLRPVTQQWSTKATLWKFRACSHSWNAMDSSGLVWIWHQNSP